MDLDQRVSRLESIVIQLQYLTLLNSDLIKTKDEKNAIAQLSALVGQIAGEHGLQVESG